MDELRFDGQVAVVTGGANGIGKASAMALARRGARIVIVDLGCDVSGHGSDPAAAEAAAREIRDAGGEAVGHFGHIGRPGVADEAVERALDTFGRIDIVLCNSVIERLANFYDFSRQDILDHLDTDALGAWASCKAAWPHFARQNYGRIVISASTALLGGAMGLPYALSKGASVALNRTMDGGARSSGLNVKSNVIAPFAFTRMWTSLNVGGGAEAEAQRTAVKQALPPEGVAHTVTVLAHRSCPASGQIYACSNGKVQRFVYMATPGLEARELTPEHLLENWPQVDSLEGSRELVGTSMDVATPFMERAMKVLRGEAGE